MTPHFALIGQSLTRNQQLHVVDMELPERSYWFPCDTLDVVDIWYCGNGTEPIAIWGGEVWRGRERERERKLWRGRGEREGERGGRMKGIEGGGKGE